MNSITKSKSQIIKENLCTLLLIDKKVSIKFWEQACIKEVNVIKYALAQANH